MDLVDLHSSLQDSERQLVTLSAGSGHCICRHACAEGKGRLIDRHTVEVALAAGGTRRLTAKNILLAQGGEPVKADVPGKVVPHLPDVLHCSSCLMACQWYVTLTTRMTEMKDMWRINSCCVS